MKNNNISLVDFLALNAASDKRPLVRYGKGYRAISAVVGKPNAKGMITVETVPDLMDGNVAKRFQVSKSMPIAGWVRIKK